VQEVALALSDNLPAPKQQPSKRRRRRRKKKTPGQPAEGAGAATPEGAEPKAEGGEPAKPKRRRRRKKPAEGDAPASAEPAEQPEAD
jgi:hypothetical protein